MKDFFISFLVQFFILFGTVYLFGFLIYLCNKGVLRNLGSVGFKFYLYTGIIGTSIHEISHAIMCLVFLHKIDEIKLFSIKSDEGTLGYVSHSYKKRLYQTIGNFFIGVAPVFFTSFLLFLFAYYLVPNFNELSEFISLNLKFAPSMLTDVQFYKSFLNLAYISFFQFFKLSNSYMWWVFIVLYLLVALHMNLSTEDIKGFLSGLLALFITMIVVEYCIFRFSPNTYTAILNNTFNVSMGMIFMLLLSLCMSLILLLLSFVFSLFTKK